jgi:hypothetical protein
MMPELYHTHLSEKLTSANYLLTILLIEVVQSIKEVTLESIATKLAVPIKFESRRKKVQRFLSNEEWDLDKIWLSLVISWIKDSVNQNNVISLAIDRTKWQSKSNNWQVVVELMALSPHKLPNYQQGLRAMRLILSAL